MRDSLKKARIENGFTVVDISKKLNISTSFYYKIESGLRNPTITLAKEVSKLLKKDIDSLFFNNNLDEMSNKSA